MGSGQRPPAPPLTEPLPVQDAFANGVEAWIEGAYTWLAFFSERRPFPGEEKERIVTSRVQIPTSDFERIKAVLLALNPNILIDIKTDGSC